MAVIFSGCSNTSQSDAQEQPLQRYASVTGLKPEKLEYYKQLHAAAWPAVLKKIKACNIENYSIYLKEIKGEYFLFSYFEYRGNNFKSDMAKMAADPETQRWWKETDPCQLPLDDAKAEGKIWSDMEEVFHTD
ncbi:L-rhamnose mutarotase [Sphingobacterium sp. Mn56C]|uniref:L-rhamnose mutarotase n=1 Tax=Sphingobacterium sp. Mn56C TaxID=3395261 RepID=UPI003BEA3BF5